MTNTTSFYNADTSGRLFYRMAGNVDPIQPSTSLMQNSQFKALRKCEIEIAYIIFCSRIALDPKNGFTSWSPAPARTHFMTALNEYVSESGHRPTPGTLRKWMQMAICFELFEEFVPAFRRTRATLAGKV